MLAVTVAATTSFLIPTNHIITQPRFASAVMTDSDRFTFEDPTTILNNFFGKVKKAPSVMTGLDKDGKTGVNLSGKSGSKKLDLVADACIDWAALTPREVAAAFIQLKNGDKEAAETLLTNVMAEMKTMESQDWGLLAVEEEKPATEGSKPSGFYSGM